MELLEFTAGTVLVGKYRVERVLGEGGMGLVLAAHHLLLDERVALKLLLPDALKDPATVARFDREARAAVKIKSEHVARVIDVGKLESGAPFMVMEYLEGEDIEHAILRRGPLPLEESVGFILEACEAIAEAHALGIVHRDLKPGNLFVTNRPSGPPIVKVLDFGISKLTLSEKEKALTSEKAMMGSPAYMSPEHLMTAHAAGVPSDIWALGVVLYEMLTAKVPFDGNSMPELVAAILRGGHKPASQERPGVPPEIDAVIARCVAKDPKDRFQNVGDLARAIVMFGPPRAVQSLEKIEHVLSGGMSRQPSLPSISRPSLPQITPIHHQTFSPTTSSVSTQRRRALLVPGIILGGLLMGGVGVGVFFATRGPRHGQAGAEPSAVVAARPAEPSDSTSEGASPTAAPPPSLTLEPSASTEAPAPSVPSSPSAAIVPSASAASATTGRHNWQAPATGTGKAGPNCHLVTSYDAMGRRHFRQECK